ncbi:MAG: hypothetical protein Q8O61_15575 [Nocardioides sp.]|nr:hypothetical protein [Nocardioides sp.]
MTGNGWVRIVVPVTRYVDYTPDGPSGRTTSTLSTGGLGDPLRPVPET